MATAGFISSQKISLFSNLNISHTTGYQPHYPPLLFLFSSNTLLGNKGHTSCLHINRLKGAPQLQLGIDLLTSSDDLRVTRKDKGKRQELTVNNEKVNNQFPALNKQRNNKY